jgi:glycosyltransferase involved in cell wall biosynthesis
MILSILTCTLPERAHLLSRLSNKLTPQMINKPVEFLVDPRNRTVPTGRKRNDLIRQAQGKYVCFVDDDDNVSGDYVDEILKAAEQDPDVITFCGWMTTDGRQPVDWVIKLGEEYEARNGIIYRFPNHLAVIRKEYAERISFPPIYQQEDYRWAVSMRNSGLLKTEVHIPKKLYHYDYHTVK